MSIKNVTLFLILAIACNAANARPLIDSLRANVNARAAQLDQMAANHNAAIRQQHANREAQMLANYNAQLAAIKSEQLRQSKMAGLLRTIEASNTIIAENLAETRQLKRELTAIKTSWYYKLFR